MTTLTYRRFRCATYIDGVPVLFSDEPWPELIEALATELGDRYECRPYEGLYPLTGLALAESRRLLDEIHPLIPGPTEP